MGRRRRQRPNPLTTKSEDELWCEALERPLDDSFSIQLVGISSPTQTAFARVVQKSNCSSHVTSIGCCTKPQVTIGRVVCYVAEDRSSYFHVADEKDRLDGGPLPSARELFRLGSVWVLNHEGERPKPRRATEEDERYVPDWSHTSIRVHFNPSRFPAAYRVDWSKYCDREEGDSDCAVARVEIDGKLVALPNESVDISSDGAIVYEDFDLGYVILNKPGGLPAHSTVCNSVENIRSLFKQELKSRLRTSNNAGKENEDLYVTLPQRLDTETSGLLAVAIRKEFASYMSKLLQKKTERHVLERSACDAGEELTGDVAGIRKKYRCLVCVQDTTQVGSLEQLRASRSVVTHYLDPQPSVPRKFVLEPPAESKAFQKCHLRITNVENEFVNAAEKSWGSQASWIAFAQRLWGGAGDEVGEFVQGVVELEIELLTGRTHQIRGQLAALGFPIVGDSLYGGGICHYVDINGRRFNRMALQCCEISFAEPYLDIASKKRKVLVPSPRRCSFQLKRGWWTQFF